MCMRKFLSLQHHQKLISDSQIITFSPMKLINREGGGGGEISRIIIKKKEREREREGGKGQGGGGVIEG